jgi:hypothetical protein
MVYLVHHSEKHRKLIQCISFTLETLGQLMDDLCDIGNFNMHTSESSLPSGYMDNGSQKQKSIYLLGGTGRICCILL